MTEVIFLPNIKRIGEYACAYADNLLAVDIPEGVESIGDYALSGCKQLLTARIPDSLKKFGSNVFYKCSKLVPSHIDVDNKVNNDDVTSEVIEFLRDQVSSAPLFRWKTFSHG